MMKFVVDGVKYNVEITGDRDPLLLLHGFTGASTTWFPLTNRLKGKRTCIMPDLIGHGKTSAPDIGKLYEMDAVVKQLTHILDKLKIKKVDLLGYSMGGRLALAFAVQNPHRVRKLIIESASPGLKTAEERAVRREQDKQLATFILEKGVSDFVDYWEDIPLFNTQKSLPEKSKELIRKERLKNSSQGLANSLLYMGTGSQKSYWEQLTTLPMETLFVVGELDEKFCLIAKEMEQLTNKGKKVIVSNCGHAIHVENCEKFGTIVSEFLSN